MSGYCIACQEKPQPPRVVVVGLASCFGCQLQITNVEEHLLDVLGQIDLRYWQLTVRQLRERAGAVIAIGACATTAGIPGMAAAGFSERPGQVYDLVPEACGDMVAPQPVGSVIDVDFEVRTCPVDSLDFIDVLQRALYGSNKAVPTRTMCGDCKRNETSCFFGKQQLCLGLVTRAGCGARCVNLGRPCNGCRGLSPDANLPSAREACERYGVPVADFDKALEMFNQVNPALAASE